ncbi:tape measure protein [Yersinia enterocolitica]|uniref:tape measure protein n=2 Tax=Yersinia enterocolitica TaxID=630 RepID=UPI000657C8DF|nr:tape measure protein [Yersinia enterocolitica]CRX56197.1 Phage-related minor tail protein [Yersinia enterocolitica]
MAGEQQLGNIVYQVEMELGKLITSQQQVNSRLDKMEGKFDATAKSVDRAEKSMFSLSRVATSLATALSVQQIAQYGNAWVTVSNKLVNAIRANEDLLTVTNRVFDISQDTRAGLEATATLYGRLERATRSAGTSTADLAKLTTTINKGLVVSGATAEEASSTMIQLSQALASGVLRGEEFNSISENGSRLAVALADSLGVTVGQLRAMAAEGKLTTDVVVNGLLKQSDAIAKEFGNTVLTMGQAFTVASNNITKFIGESSSVNTALNIFNQGVISLSENLGTIANIIGVVAAVVGSRYVSALVLATSSQVRLAATAYAAASAQGALAVAAKVASGALALVGGPVGLATLAAAAIFYFYQSSVQAREESIKFADSLDGVIGKMKEMSAVQLRATIAETNQSLTAQTENASKLSLELADLKNQLYNANSAMENSTAGSWAYSNAQAKARELTDEVAKKTAEYENAQNKLASTQSNLSIITEQYVTTMRNNATATDVAIEKGGVLAGIQNKVASAFGVSTDAVTGYNKAVSLTKPLSDDSQKLIKAAERRVALAKAEGTERAKLQAQYAAEDAGVTDDRAIKRTQDLAVEEYNLGEAKKNTKKETAAAAKEETATEAAEKRRVKSLQDLSNEMAVAELKTKGLNREAAQLAAVQDLGSGASQQQIQQATQQAGQIFDIQQRIADKKAAIDADSVAKAEQQRKLDLSQLDRQLAAGDISFEQSQQRRAQISADYSRAIAEASAASAVMPQQQNAALVDPVQALANENAQKLALIQKFEEDKTLTEQQALALRNAANTQYEQARLAAQWEIWRNQSQSNQYLASSINALGQRTTNMLTGLLTGTQSAEEAMKNLAATIIQEGVNALVQMGMQQVKNIIMGQAAATTALAATAAQATAAAAAWAPAAVSASIATMGGASTVGTTAYGTALAASKGLAMAGARKNGGPVSAGEMYRVGEGGAPEIYQAGTGKQYMIPGDNGKVISNKVMQGGSGGGGTVVQQEVHFHIETTNGIDDATMQKMAAMMKTVSLNTIKDQQRPNGLLRK